MQITFDPKDPTDVQNVCDLLGLTVGEPGDAPNISASPENRVDPEQEEIPELDSLGMPHNEAYHQSPPTMNKDGTFKAKRGEKEALEAAIAAHKAADTSPAEETAPTATTMPTGMPGMAAPAAPVTYEAVSQRFVALMESGKITDYAAVYAAAGVTDPTALQTNETLRAALWAELDKLDA